MRSWLLFFGASSYGLTIPANEDSYTAPRNTLREKLPVPKPSCLSPSLVSPSLVTKLTLAETEPSTE